MTCLVYLNDSNFSYSSYDSMEILMTIFLIIHECFSLKKRRNFSENEGILVQRKSLSKKVYLFFISGNVVVLFQNWFGCSSLLLVIDY